MINGGLRWFYQGNSLLIIRKVVLTYFAFGATAAFL